MRVDENVSREELNANDDIIVLAYGATDDSALSVLGEEIKGVCTATQLVSQWDLKTYFP